MSFIVGLTGGIGSGKSTVADLFVKCGAALVDTDLIAHELTGPLGQAMGAIRAEFGASLLRADGGLDRAAMRKLVFSDPSAKARLEAILHPMIRAESAALCAAVTTAPYVLLAVPLLVETGGFREQVDRVLVVDCDEAVQISRVMARSGLSIEELQAIMSAQASRAARRASADDLLLNDDGKEALLFQVEVLHRHYLALAAAKLNADC
jgi:dephospho-CoA kinase